MLETIDYNMLLFIYLFFIHASVKSVYAYNELIEIEQNSFHLTNSGPMFILFFMNLQN